MNPQHTVPTLNDNGKLLWDSHAISIYLIEKYGNSDDHPLYPKDLYIRARINQRLHFESGVLFPSLQSVVLSSLFDSSHKVSKKERGAIHSGYNMLETFLSDSYLVGNEMTVADLSVISTLTHLETLFELSSVRYPKINAWIERMKELSFFHDTNTVLIFTEPVWQNIIARNRTLKIN